MNKNITMRDIANQLGVSSVTVSKALNDKEGVSDELKERIKQLASELGYRVNMAAKTMREGLTYNIGVIIPERFTGPDQSFYLRVYQEISKSLEATGYYGILHILSGSDEEGLLLPRIYYDRKVDGFIVLGQINKSYIEVIENIEQPKLFLDFYDEHSSIDSVVTDNFYGAYELTNYLIQQGHRDIAYVGNLYSTSSIQDRFLGYYKSLLEHHIHLEPKWIINDRDEQGTYIDIELPSPLPTAFVCNCDQVAYSVVQKLKLMGHRVPEDCSVVGFDNDIYATLMEPHLTTIDVNINQMAQTAVQSLLRQINHPDVRFGRLVVKGEIIYRDSVKPLNPADRSE
ncbi:substrate-binding domain-containing protein [Paenibacillus gallinarum]|uniref:LacI family DNA-binding transcriptional regulator n=1 Tax=Paenibacillus gallinarum TaxID=2762232 RepID=A0ABR8SYG7_9BACL|nr:substrate-binding domain-containing protein [Paenibacillus gallinarum]MBD7968530.1 LacI family DNA-binding transcriptional regulator [Paenibacillus gallinarum]